MKMRKQIGEEMKTLNALREKIPTDEDVRKGWGTK